MKKKKLWSIFRPSTSYPRPSTSYPRPSTLDQKADSLRGRTSAFLIFGSFGHSYVGSRQKGRTCRRYSLTDFMSNVNTKCASATPAYCLCDLRLTHASHFLNVGSDVGGVTMFRSFITTNDWWESSKRLYLLFAKDVVGTFDANFSPQRH